MAASHWVPEWITDYHRATREPATTALATLPLLLLYGLGLLVTGEPARSGVDWVSPALLGALTREGYIGVQLGLALAITGWAAWTLRRALGRRLALTAPLIAESTLYALTLGGLILIVLDELSLLGPSAEVSGLFARAVASAGAGLWEEFLFRLLLLSLILVALQRAFSLPKPLAAFVAIAISSFAFAAAHHVAGEPLDLFAFAYRTTAGLVFAALFMARGFAVAAWTHAAYDFYVFSL